MTGGQKECQNKEMKEQQKEWKNTTRKVRKNGGREEVKKERTI
jgi:hypothetical protein